ncbi:MAG TPA: glycosyltransferase [Croceibacterium sp.]|nr:glycosyltransferase [Croceibacterium sp.]
MSALLTGAGWLLTAAAGGPLAVFSTELLAGLWPAARRKRSPVSARIAILIPAHDEEAGIVDTVGALLEQVPPGARVIVIADNCTDSTAALAREAGAEVIERNDPDARGKGYALAFGGDHLALSGDSAPDVVLVVDADCRLLPGSIDTLAEAALRLGVPVQADYLFNADLVAAPMVQISNFAMLVKNRYRSRGMQRLGGAALLTGTGMAFPWTLYAEADLATGSIVEDLSFGVAMTRKGYPPKLIEEAEVRSAPAALGDTLAQRTRWEHGFLKTLCRDALPVLFGGLRRISLPEILLGLHLAVPPLALLLVLAGAALALQVVLALLGGSAAALATLAAITLFALTMVVAAWLGEGRAYLSGHALLRAPVYVLWKLPVYARFLRKPEASWNRTPRRPEG